MSPISSCSDPLATYAPGPPGIGIGESLVLSFHDSYLWYPLLPLYVFRFSVLTFSSFGLGIFSPFSACPNSLITITGPWYLSAQLMLRAPASKHSSTEPGANMGMVMSPCPGCIHAIRSLCSDLVGSPVDGPPRCTLTMTHGISAIHASPMPSDIKESPGPAVAVIAFLPEYPAPTIAFIDSISEDTWYANRFCPMRFCSIQTSIVVAGDMGYPA